MSKPIYLDYAAATPLDSEVLAAMKPYFSNKFFNPSAIYLGGRQVRLELEESRASVAKILGARPAEVTFTAGATEANNLALQGIMKKFPGGQMLVSSIEHESVLAPAEIFKSKTIPVTAKGLVQPDTVAKMISDSTVLVSIGLVNNEIGIVQPLPEIAAKLEVVRAARLKSGNKMPLYLHTDAAQAGSYLDLHASRLGVDLLSLNGGKIYGPKQSGVLFVKTGTFMQPILQGGGQEHGLRSGTENVAGCIGLAKALELAQFNRPKNSQKVRTLRELLIGELAQHIPVATINGHSKHYAPHIISVTIPGQDNERLMMQLDELGVVCAVGSACSASSDKASHVLMAIGLDDKAARSTLRFSLGKTTTAKEIKKTVQFLKQSIS